MGQRLTHGEVCASQIWGVLARHVFVVCCTGALHNVLRAPLLAQDGRSSLRNPLILLYEKIFRKKIKKILTLLSK
jgi:hypothetical protein